MGEEEAPTTAPVEHDSDADKALREMNECFAKSMALVCPPIQYPPHSRFNPVQQDAADTVELEEKLQSFFLNAKQLEMHFLQKELNDMTLDSEVNDHELVTEIAALEAELAEKNDLIEKYAEVAKGWEGKFKRLQSRMTVDKDT